MASLALVTPVTESELSAYRPVFDALRRNLRDARVPADLFVVVQANAAAHGPDLDFLRDTPGVEVVTTTRFSASAARNLGIACLRPEDHRFVCFLDSDAVPSVGLLRSVRSHLDEADGILVGGIHWHEGDAPGRFVAEEPARRVPIGRWLLSTYLLSTFLPVEQVLAAGARFDESIGPGEDTRLKSGEDVLFLCQVVVANRVTAATVFDAVALHPPRPRDFSKHLAYAEGQGALFVRLLRSRMRRSLKASVLAAFGLFLGNALLRVLTLRRRALPILRLRLRGALEGFRLETLSS